MLLLSVNPPQQEEALDSFVKRISSSAVSFTYSCVIGDGGAEVTGEGTVDMQGDAYIVRGNGLEVYCDGRTRWTVDRQAQEAVVEAYDPDSPDYSVNPAALLRSFDKAFKVTCVSVSGKSLDYTLEPVSSGTDIAELRLSLSADAKANSVEIRVYDNGIGIEASILDKVFDPFFTTKTTAEAVGVGMYLSREIILNHGGNVSVQSTKDEYTEFVITLPIHHDGKGGTAHEAEAPAQPAM